MERRQSRTTWALFAALFVVSGACALTYEVVWSRRLVPVFGVTAFAISTVLVAFMGGMALGAAWIGRRADRLRRPLRLFALLEAGIGLYALLFPLFLAAVEALFHAAMGLLPDALAVRSSVRFVLALLLLFPPTILMGGTLPALGRGLVLSGRVGRGVGLLYFVNTLGAAAGCYVAGFHAVPWLGLDRTTWVAVALNFLVALVAWQVDRRAAGAEETPAVAPTPAAAVPTPALRPPWWPWAVAFGSGMAALAFEIVWFRVLVLVFGSTVYSFSAMLSVFLLGLAIGAAVGGWAADRLAHPARLLFLTQGAVALMALAGAIAVNLLPELFLRLLRGFGLDFVGMNRTKFVLSLITLLPPALAFGATFPVAVRLEPPRRGGTGARIGRVYAFNTLGAILGSFGAGFLLLPSLGSEMTLRLVIGVATVLALGSLLADPAPLRKRWALPAAALIVVLVAGNLFAPRWDRRLLGSGIYFEPQRHYAADGSILIEPIVGDYRLTTYEEGYNDTIISFESIIGKFITVNGSTTASDQFEDMLTQRMLGHLPLALHPGDPREVLIVGLGAGVTAGAMGLYDVDRVVAVELERGVFDSSRFFARENHHVLDNPKVTVRIDDGRNYLRLGERRYDVISSAANFPSLTGSGGLYSVDYFRLTRERLAPGGIMCQFAPLWRMFPDDVKTIVASFQQVYPHVRFFSVGLSLVMLGREEPFPAVDLDLVEARLAAPTVAASLEEIGVAGGVDLLAHYVFDEQEGRRYAAGAELNTDDFPRTEFRAPRALFTATVGTNLDDLRRFLPDPAVRAERLGLDGSARERFLARAAAKDASQRGRIELAAGRLDSALALLQPLATAGDRYPAHLLAAFAEEQGARMQREHRLEEAEQLFGLALSLEPERHDALVGLGYLDLRAGRTERAERLLAVAVRSYPRSAAARYRLGLVRDIQGQPAEAERLYREAIDLRPRAGPPHALLARLLVAQGRAEEGLAQAERAVALGEVTEGLFATRATALLLLGRDAEARRVCDAGLVRYPQSTVLPRLRERAGSDGAAGR